MFLFLLRCMFWAHLKKLRFCCYCVMVIRIIIFSPFVISYLIISIVILHNNFDSFTIFLSVCMSMGLLCVFPFVHFFHYFFVSFCLSRCLSFCLSNCLSLCLSHWLSLCLFFCQYLGLFLYIFCFTNSFCCSSFSFTSKRFLFPLQQYFISPSLFISHYFTLSSETICIMLAILCQSVWAFKDHSLQSL